MNLLRKSVIYPKGILNPNLGDLSSLNSAFAITSFGYISILCRLRDSIGKSKINELPIIMYLCILLIFLRAIPIHITGYAIDKNVFFKERGTNQDYTDWHDNCGLFSFIII